MSPVVDFDSIHGAVAAALAAVAATVAFARRRWWNAKDTLQRRLAAHLEDYVASDQHDDARTTLRDALKTEFRQRAVTHDQRSNRVRAALDLVKPQMTLPQIASLTSTLEKMGYSV